MLPRRLDVYQHVRHVPAIEALVGWAVGESLPLVGIDNLPGSVPLEASSAAAATGATGAGGAAGGALSAGGLFTTSCGVTGAPSGSCRCSSSRVGS